MKKKTTLAAVAALTLACSASAAGTFAYLQSSSEKVENTFLSAGGGLLVSSLELDEHEAVKGVTGAYTLDAESLVKANEYDVLPGVDIPKDPTIHINGKTSADAYLYVEVVDNITEKNPMSWEIANTWTELTGVTGANAGRIYVYNKGTTSPVILDEKTWAGGDADIQILKNNVVKVDDGTLKLNADSKLTFYAYMAQASAGSDAKEAYNACFAGGGQA